MKLCKYYCVRWWGVTFPDRALTASASVSSFGETDIARKYLFGRLRHYLYVWHRVQEKTTAWKTGHFQGNKELRIKSQVNSFKGHSWEKKRM